MKEEEKTKILNELNELTFKKKEDRKKNKKNNIIAGIFLSIPLLSSIAFLLYNVFRESDNQFSLVINSFIITLAIILFILLVISNNKSKKIITIILGIILMSFVTFNFLVSASILKLPTLPKVIDFTNKSINEAIKWASENNIKYEQVYEYSDNIDEYNIISQNVLPNTPIKEVNLITFTVSSGPNYDKSVIIPNMIGLNIDEALKTLKENFLNNIDISFEINNEVEKNTIFEQSVTGQMRRNELLKLKVSLGNKESFTTVKMVDLKDMSLFDATLWLKRNAINYKLEYQFSDKIKRNFVISQDTLKDTDLTPFESNIVLIISKGVEIKVPDFSKMTIEEITKWVIENNLKISYSDEYHSDIPLGKLISSNYKENDIIEEGTEIKLLVSKGQLKMLKFNNINEFRTWASKYNIVTEEKYEYNNNVKKGEIIKFSHQENDIINPNEKIVIYISNGNPITIPNFVGKSKTEIINSCNKLGLNCTFFLSGYSASGKDIAVSQNKKSGSEVVSGTYVNIGLSKGIASTFTVEITESLLSIGNADQTINSLKSYFANKYPDVTFTFQKKQSNTYNNGGFIHESSPIKDGSKVTQGNSYTVWITE